MEPRIKNLANNEDVLTFTLYDINVSLANAIRRTVLANIPTVVFRTFPHEQCKATFEINKCRMNNELLKQRLSCIPIHITDVNFPLEDYIVEVHKINDSDSIDFVTTEDFKIKNIKTDTYLNDADTKKIFPPSPLTGDYIDFARLRPRLSEDIPGEELKFNCAFDIGRAEEDGAFNVASTCTYAATVDQVKINATWSAKARQLKDEGLSPEEIDFEHKNWLLLEAKRITLPDSFDFTVESVGVFSNMNIIFKALHIIMDKLDVIGQLIESEEHLIKASDNTIPNCFDITLVKEDYTIGKILEYMLFTTHYGKTLTFCGFLKKHPHDEDSIIRIAFKESADNSEVIAFMMGAISKAKSIYQNIAAMFEE